MSVKQFESFLVNQFVAWASDKVEPGFRYQFKSPDNDNSLRLYKAMLEHTSGEITVDDSITLPYIQSEGCKIVPVVHSENADEYEGFTENYISHLRDEVAGQNGFLAGCALVVIHNSLLDTLINSADDLAQKGAVWSPKRIKESLEGLIDQQDKGRDVSCCLLDHQFDQINEDGATMFGFESLYNAVEDGDLRFNELGMFEDPMVIEMSGNPQQIKKRLEENRALYEELEFEVEHFGDQLGDRLKAFGDKFVKENFSEPNAWKDVEFENYQQEKKRNAQQQLVLEDECIVAGGTLVARNKSETKSGQRDRQIIIVLDEEQNDFELKLTFQGADLDKSQFKVQPAKALNKTEEISTRNGTKNAYATLKAAYAHEPMFFTLALKREVASERYNFRCLVVRKGEFHIDAFSNVFLIEPSKKRITLNIDENTLQIRDGEGESYSLKDCGENINVAEFTKVDFEAMANEADEIDFNVVSGDNKLTFNVEGAVATDSLSLPLMLNRDRFVKLYDDEYFGEFYSLKGKVGIDNSEFVVPGLRLKLLRVEERFVTENALSIFEDKSAPLSQLAEVDQDLFNAYTALYDYLVERRSLPSLVSWGPNYQALVEAVVDAFLLYFDGIEKGTALTAEQKLVLTIGNVTIDGEEYMSPFHPIVMSYYLYLCEQIISDESGSFAKLPDVTFERLSPKGLLPYIYHAKHDFSYTQQVKENAFWLRSVPHQKTSHSFVRKLVKEKINEFKNSFKQLFTTDSESCVIINAVNQDKAEELFLGLVDYIRDNQDKASSIHVNLYDDVMSFNAFDKFAETASYDVLKDWLELNKGKWREQADTIIDLLRTRLTYSKFTNKQAKDGQAYSHLTFFRSNEKVDCVDVAIDDAASGIACDGLMSGEASESKSGSYFTAFGLKNVEYEDLPHLRMAKAVGSLLQPAVKPNTQYHGSNAVALAVSEDFKTLLERSYASSIWTTIIDPKVTLDFFHSNQDVVLIHYSDQYTSSASYDAITVTKQTGLFEKVLDQGDGGLISEFNAFNGDWLLKMMTCSNTLRKERKGIIGAYKFVTGLVHESDITWVPLSVGEMIRVSGNIGLKMSDSDFSRNVQGYKKGEISDDILFVGFKDDDLYLLPAEVKTGSRPDYKKAVSQAKELHRYLSQDILGQQTLAGKLYRSLFIRQVLMQVDKYKLYNVFEDGYFDKLLAEREQWLRGEYDIAQIAGYPQGFVISHLESASCIEPNYQLVDSILKVDLPMALLPNLVADPLQVILKEKNVAKLCYVPEQYLLGDTRSEAIRYDGTTENEGKQEVVAEKGALETAIDEENRSVTEAPALQPELNEVQEPVSSVPVSNETKASGNNLHVLFGHNELTKAPLQWEPTNTAKFMNTNTGIIGTMGTGKTQFTKSVITQLHRNKADNVDGKAIGMLIFDYKSDYVDDKFQNATEGKKFNLHKLPYNPLSLFGDTPMLPVHTARGFSETMGKAFGLGQKQQLRLRKLVGEAYDLAGIKKADKSTWSRPAPTIADVWSLFIEDDPTEDSLYAALESLYELEIFEDDVEKCTSLYELVDGITVIELAGYPSEIQNLVVALTLDLFYSQMQKKGKPEVQGDFRQITKMILVDEADNFMSQNFPSLRKILKEGREYGVGMILSTQDITHFQTGENDYSSYVLTWVVHRVAKIKAQDIKAIFSVNEKAEQENLMQTINKLEKHCSLYIDGDKKIQKMRDKAFWELIQ